MSVLSHFRWVFIEDVRALLTPSYKVMFDYVRYLGILYNWNIKNDFLI